MIPLVSNQKFQYAQYLGSRCDRVVEGRKLTFGRAGWRGAARLKAGKIASSYN